jgi:hypothetical protein
MFSNYFLNEFLFLSILFILNPIEDNSFLRSKGMKRIIVSLKKFLFFSILDRVLKLCLVIIFKLIQIIKKHNF